ncbi:hypothetical protein GLOIN_2v1792321 [Rhizophagus clarus]|uniref:Uncharacterized protein n=1 Tax=Rhizophagus clarus TaxID=94130 RepID=A0A8H3KUH9_9GLOM|nr:hypothetical protein GLOIN_2v1792321 [Rhizophagus clarus]
MFGTIILDEQFNKIVPKPINNRSGYNMKYVSAYIVNHCYGTDLKKIIRIEWEYDTLSVVKPGQSLVAWADLGMAKWLILTIISPESIRVIWLFALIAGNCKYTKPKNITSIKPVEIKDFMPSLISKFWNESHPLTPPSEIFI